MVAAAARAWAMTASTSAFDATLCARQNSVALGLPSGRPESCARLLRGQSARRKPACRSKKATAPYSNSLPTMPSVLKPRPSR
jgi:hypothetical protein